MLRVVVYAFVVREFLYVHIFVSHNELERVVSLDIIYGRILEMICRRVLFPFSLSTPVGGLRVISPSRSLAFQLEHSYTMYFPCCMFKNR